MFWDNRGFLSKLQIRRCSLLSTQPLKLVDDDSWSDFFLAKIKLTGQNLAPAAHTQVHHFQPWEER